MFKKKRGLLYLCIFIFLVNIYSSLGGISDGVEGGGNYDGTGGDSASDSDFSDGSVYDNEVKLNSAVKNKDPRLDWNQVDQGMIWEPNV